MYFGEIWGDEVLPADFQSLIFLSLSRARAENFSSGVFYSGIKKFREIRLDFCVKGDKGFFSDRHKK